MKTYEWIDKRPYFQNIKRKKIEKNKLSRVLNPLTQNHILLQMVDFLIAGHTCEIHATLRLN